MASKDIFFQNFQGINNLRGKNLVSNNQFVDALNFDVSGDKDSGFVLRTRERWKKVLELNDGHSLFSTKKLMYFVDGDNLCAYDKNGVLSVIDTGYRGLKTSYTELNNSVIISNNNFIRRYSKGKIYNLTPQQFDNNKLFTTTENNGNLRCGNYLVGCTFVHDDGVESSTSSPLMINVSENGLIKISNFPDITDLNIDKIRVYISRENSTSLHLYGEYGIDVSEVVIYNVASVGQLLDKINLLPLQPGHLMDSWNGVILTAKDNFVYLSKPFTYFYDNYLEYDNNITMIATVQDGFYTSDEEAVYFSNNTTSPGRTQLEYSAVLYSMSKDKRSGDIFFFSQHGQFKGSDGGKIQPISTGFKPDLELIKGASMFLDRNGEDRVISSFLSNGEKSSLVFKDWVKIEKV